MDFLKSMLGIYKCSTGWNILSILIINIGMENATIIINGHICCIYSWLGEWLSACRFATHFAIYLHKLIDLLCIAIWNGFWIMAFRCYINDVHLNIFCFDFQVRHKLIIQPGTVNFWSMYHYIDYTCTYFCNQEIVILRMTKIWLNYDVM